MAQLWDWTPRPTCTRLLHDVAAKPAVLSTPVNDQVLIYTPESREASVGEFLAQGNCDSVASTWIKSSTLITEYKILDVITNALPSAPPCPLPHTHGKWIRSCRSLWLRPHPVGWVPVHYVGVMGRAKQYPGAWPGTRRSTD